MMCGNGLPHPEPLLHMCSPGSAGRFTPLCYDPGVDLPDANHWVWSELTNRTDLVTCSTCTTILKGPPQ